MATNYPGSLDNFTNPTSASPINSPSHADQHSNANDAIEAIEGELGANPKGAKATVKARLDDVDTAIATKAPIASPTFTGTVTIPAGSAIDGVPYLATANTFTGGVQQITTASASTIGLIVKASASQSVNLIQTQDSTGASYFGVSTFGDTRIGITSSVGGKLGISTGGTTNIGLVVRGVASQTADLQQWQNSSGTALAAVTSGGRIWAGSMTVATSGAVTAASQFGVVISSASTVGIGIKAAASQTANLLEFQSSAGGLYSRFDSVGQYQGVYAVLSSDAVGTLPLKVKGASGQTANLTEWQDSSGGLLTAINNSGQIATFGRLTVGSSVVSTDARMVLLNTGTTTSVLQIIRGIASQTADLQQWQDSAGSVLSRVQADGTIVWGSASSSLQNSSGRLIVNLGSAASVGITVKGAASQTANLTEWQDSTANPLAWVNFGGGIRGASFRTTSLNSVNAPLAILATSTTSPAAVIRALASQTANLQEWQNSAGTVLSSITSTGLMNTTVGLNANALYIGNGYLGANIQSAFSASTASYVPIVVRGAASQTANLQEWQNSSGTVLSRITSSGQLGVPNVYSVNGSGAFITMNSTNGAVVINTNAAGNIGTIIRGTASQSANLQEWQDSAGNVLAKVDANGSGTFTGSASTNGISAYAGSGGSYAFQGFNSSNSLTSIIYGSGEIYAGSKIYVFGAANYGASINVTTPSTSTQAIIVRGRASQTGNLQEWQNSSGDVDTAVTSTGRLSVRTTLADAGLNVGTPSAATVGQIIRGAASQTANLQEWQNSSGTVTARFTKDGEFSVTDAYVAYFSGASNYSATLNVQTADPTYAGLVIRGKSAQTGDLQKWQNSAGTVLANIGANGAFTSNVQGYATSLISISQASLTKFEINQYGQSWNATKSTFGNYYNTDSGTLPQVSILSSTADAKGLVIRGQVSQTANLQEWQDSASAVKASIGSGGNGVFNGLRSGSGSTTGAINAYTTAAQIGILVRGAASQTANLQEWQNSAGYAGTAIDSSGSFYAPGIYSSYLMQATAGEAAVVPLTVKGAASQTAKLQEWKNSTNTVVASVGVDGLINTNGSIRIAGDNLSVYRFQGVSDGNYTMNFPGSGNIQLFSAVDDLGGGSRVLGIKNATTVPTSNPTTGGILYVNSGALNYMGTSNVPQQIVGADGSIKFTSPAASITPLIIQHTASPTSSYFEIRNSAGNPVWGINSSGESRTRTTTKFGANIQNDSANTLVALNVASDANGSGYPLLVAGYGPATSTTGLTYWKSGAYPGAIVSKINYDGSLNTPYIQGNISSTISANTATTVDTVALSSFTTTEYTISIKQGLKVRSSKVLVHTDGTSVDSTEYGIIEMGGGITGILVTASVSSTNSILQVTITDAATTNATVKLIKTML